MSKCSVRFWVELWPLVHRFCREHGVSVNRLVNEAVSAFLQVSFDDGVSRLLAEKILLKEEERQLREDWNLIRRSGSGLAGYVQEVLREPGRPVSLVRHGQMPLKALKPREEEVFRKIATKREQIAARLAEIELELLKEVKPFRLKPELPRSRSRARDRNKPFGKGGA